MSAVLIARVRAHGGDSAVAELLGLAGSDRSVQYLTDIANWISFDEGVALSQLLDRPALLGGSCRSAASHR